MDELRDQIERHGRLLQEMLLVQRNLEQRMRKLARRVPSDAWLDNNLIPREGMVICSDCLTRMHAGVPVDVYDPKMTTAKKLVNSRRAALFREEHEVVTGMLRESLVARKCDVCDMITENVLCDYCYRSGKTFAHIRWPHLYFLCGYKITKKRPAEDAPPRPGKRVRFAA